eukprot:3254702-Amphidinium_carterae.1
MEPRLAPNTRTYQENWNHQRDQPNSFGMVQTRRLHLGSGVARGYRTNYKARVAKCHKENLLDGKLIIVVGCMLRSVAPKLRTCVKLFLNQINNDVASNMFGFDNKYES